MIDNILMLDYTLSFELRIEELIIISMIKSIIVTYLLQYQFSHPIVRKLNIESCLPNYV